MFRWATIFGFLLLIVACEPQPVQQSSVLRIGVLPDKSAAQLEKEFHPLIDYLSASVGKPIELDVPPDYETLLTNFVEGKYDAAFFGGLTFLQAEARSNAIPLVSRDVDARFTSVFIARNDMLGSRIIDFEGKKIAFGSKLSTSGHLMPRYFLQNLGIVPEGYFSNVTYTGAHDKTMEQVFNGSLDLGAVNAQVARQLMQSAKYGNGTLRILWETPPYADYVWAVRQDLTLELKTALQEAFLALSIANNDHDTILTLQGARSFMPARLADFDNLRELAARLGLL